MDARTIDSDRLMARRLHIELNGSASLSVNSPGGAIDLNRSRRRSSEVDDSWLPLMEDIHTKLDEQIASALQGRSDPTEADNLTPKTIKKILHQSINNTAPYSGTSSSSSSSSSTIRTTTTTTTTILRNQLNRDGSTDRLSVDSLQISRNIVPSSPPLASSSLDTMTTREMRDRNMNSDEANSQQSNARPGIHHIDSSSSLLRPLPHASTSSNDVIETMVDYASSALRAYVVAQTGGLLTKVVSDTFVVMATNKLKNAITDTMQEHDHVSIYDAFTTFMETYYNSWESNTDNVTEDVIERERADSIDRQLVANRAREISIPSTTIDNEASYYEGEYTIADDAENNESSPDNESLHTYEDLLELDDREVDYSSGLSRRDFSNLPKHKYKGGVRTSDEECNICMSELVIRKCYVRTLPCNHTYHVACIDTWLKTCFRHAPELFKMPKNILYRKNTATQETKKKPTCPICRMNVKENISELL